jgi:mRNA capping enzyme
VQAAQRLIQLSSWVVNPENPLRLYLEGCATSRTDVPLSVLKTATQSTTGGSVVHRLQDHVTKRGTLNNIRPNITSHIYFSTDRMGRFSRGSENYNLHFQGAIHLGITALAMCAFRNNQKIAGCLLKYTGTCCEEKLDDFLISCTTLKKYKKQQRRIGICPAYTEHRPPIRT